MERSPIFSRIISQQFEEFENIEDLEDLDLIDILKISCFSKQNNNKKIDDAQIDNAQYDNIFFYIEFLEIFNEIYVELKYQCLIIQILNISFITLEHRDPRSRVSTIFTRVKDQNARYIRWKNLRI